MLPTTHQELTTVETKKTYSPSAVSRLAALSRTYHQSLPDIAAAILQDMREQDTEEDCLAVAEKFGLSYEDCVKFRPEGVLRLRQGSIHRAGLCGFEETMANVLLDIQSGKLKPGTRFPPRTKFTEDYYCDKKTHGEVLSRLMKLGMVHRPGGSGGGIFVSDGV